MPSTLFNTTAAPKVSPVCPNINISLLRHQNDIEARNDDIGVYIACYFVLTIWYRNLEEGNVIAYRPQKATSSLEKTWSKLFS